MFVPGKPLQPSLMFLGKAGGSYPRVEHLKGSVNYGRKKFYSAGPWLGTLAVILDIPSSTRKLGPVKFVEIYLGRIDPTFGRKFNPRVVTILSIGLNRQLNIKL